MLGHGHRVATARLNTGTPTWPAEDPQLLDGGRALEVGAHQQRVASLLLEPAGQLGRGRRLAGTLQAGQQHDRRRPRGVGDPQRLAAERLDQLVVDDLDDLLARREALGQVRARPAPPSPDRLTVPDDEQVDVGLEQGHADLPQRLVDVVLAEAALGPAGG